MRFPQNLIVASLRKREGEAPDTTGAAPKRPRRGEPGRSSQPPIAPPEAILVEDDQEEESLPTGIPIGEPLPATSPAVVPSPSAVSGGPLEGEEIPEAGITTPPIIPETSRPAPPSPREIEAPAPADVSRGPAQPLQPPRQGTLYKSRLSETVLELAALPKFQALLRSLPLEEAFDTLFTGAIQVSNGLFVIREELVKARSRAEGLDKELLEAKTRELKALDDLRAAREDHRKWREMAEKEARILNAKLSEVMTKLAPTEEKLGDALLRAEHAEDRADTAEAAARDAAEKLVRAEKDAQEALDKMVAAERRAQERVTAIETRARERVAAAETQAQEAIERYKHSPDFFKECNEAVLDAYVQGFERCKERLSQLFKLGDLEHLRPADDEEVPDAEIEEESRAEGMADEPIAIEDPATEPIIIEDPAARSTVGEEDPEGQQGHGGACP